MSNKNLIVHVGLPKCGSKTLQNFLAVNRTLLAEHGIFYPPTSSTGGHVELMHAARDVRGDANSDMAIWHKLREEFEATGHRTLLVSHESFLGNPKRSNLCQIEAIFAGFQIDYVLYYRRFDRWIESFFRTHVINKTRYKKSFAEYINEPFIRSHSLKLRLRGLKHASPSRRHLVAIERCRIAHDIFAPIAPLCDLSESAMSSLASVESRNLSLSWSNFLLVYSANISNVSDPLREQLLQAVRAHERDNSECSVQKALHLMAPADRAKWIKHYMKDCHGLGIECAATEDDLLNLPAPIRFDADSHILEEASESLMRQSDFSPGDRQVLTHSILAQKPALVSRFSATTSKRLFGFRRAG